MVDKLLDILVNQMEKKGIIRKRMERVLFLCTCSNGGDYEQFTKNYIWR